MNKLPKSKIGDLRVWWIPQIGARIPRFEVPVDSVAEGVLVMDALAQYDLFQLKYKIKPDYCNAGGLVVCVPGVDDDGKPTGKVDWEDWYDEKTGMDPAEWVEHQKQNTREPS